MVDMVFNFQIFEAISGCGTYWRRIIGMLMQLAAATATSGTKRPTNGFKFWRKESVFIMNSVGSQHQSWLTFVRRFRLSAVVNAPPVAITYDVSNWLWERERKKICKNRTLNHRHGSSIEHHNRRSTILSHRNDYDLVKDHESQSNWDNHSVCLEWLMGDSCQFYIERSWIRYGPVVRANRWSSEFSILSILWHIVHEPHQFRPKMQIEWNLSLWRELTWYR